MRYFRLFPSVRVTDRSNGLPSSVANVRSPAMRVARLVLFTVSEYSQKKAPINVIKTNQAYWPIRFCGFIHAQLWVRLIQSFSNHSTPP